VVESLPSKCEALNSNSSTAKKKKRERERENLVGSQVWWYLPVIPATQVAKAGRVQFLGQLWQS
jgi:hypothetical protein